MRMLQFNAYLLVFSGTRRDSLTPACWYAFPKTAACLQSSLILTVAMVLQTQNITENARHSFTRDYNRVYVTNILPTHGQKSSSILLQTMHLR